MSAGVSLRVAETVLPAAPSPDMSSVLLCHSFLESEPLQLIITLNSYSLQLFVRRSAMRACQLTLMIWTGKVPVSGSKYEDKF
jgi:hypothetical protein